MITNTGKSILGKYLVGQTSSYASYLAIGCGSKPISKISHVVNNKQLSSNTATLTTASAHGLSVGDYVTVFDVDTRLNGTYQLIAGTTGSTLVYTVSSSATISSAAVSPTGVATVSFAEKTSMDFEMIRVPVISKSFITDSGVSKVVLTAELPTSERYEISEIGIYPSDNNPTIVGEESQNISLFTTIEPWQYHTSAGVISSLPINLGTITNANNDITTLDEAFYTNADNALFDSVLYPARITRYERPRFLNNIVMVRGNNSTLVNVSGNLKYSSGSHIHLAGNLGDFSKNSTNDELKLAFSVINKLGIGSSDVPSNVKILIEFATSEDVAPAGVSIGTQTPSGTTNITMTTSANHNFSVGQNVVISGVTPSGYNGTWVTQTGTTGTTLVVNIGSNPGAITVGGNVTTYATAEYASFSVNLDNGTSAGQHDFTNNRYVVVTKKLSELYKTTNFDWSQVAFVRIFTCVNNNSTDAEKFFVAYDAMRLENVSSFNSVYGLTGYTKLVTDDLQPIIKSENTSNFIEFKHIVDVF
jgi:hypothetical protein